MDPFQFEYFLDALMNLQKFNPSKQYLDFIYNRFTQYFKTGKTEQLQVFMEDLLQQYPREECWNDAILYTIELLIDQTCMEKIYEKNLLTIADLEKQIRDQRELGEEGNKIQPKEAQTQQFLDQAYNNLKMEKQLKESVYSDAKLEKLQNIFNEFQQKVLKEIE